MRRSGLSVVLVTLLLTVLVEFVADCATSRAGTIPLVPENLLSGSSKRRKLTCSMGQATRSANTTQARPGNRTMEARWLGK